MTSVRIFVIFHNLNSKYLTGICTRAPPAAAKRSAIREVIQLWDQEELWVLISALFLVAIYLCFKFQEKIVKVSLAIFKKVKVFARRRQGGIGVFFEQK